MAKSTALRARKKSAKPVIPIDGYPLYCHSTGRLAKRIKGKVYYFGRWGTKQGPQIVPVDDILGAAQAAKEEYERQVFYILKGETPPPLVDEDDERWDLFDLREKFLEAKEHRVKVGKLAPQTFSGYRRAMTLLIDFFGKAKVLETLTPAEFSRFYRHLDRGQNPTSLSNDIRNIKIALKYAVDSDLVAHPFKYGPDFKRPQLMTVRAAEQEHERLHGKRMFESKDLRLILDALEGRGEHAQEQTPRNIMGRAWVLLGLNCGFGPSDLSNIEASHFDLKSGWVDYARPKTRVPRHIPLWDETISAVRKALSVRPEPKNAKHARRAFLTVTGLPLVNITAKGHATDSIGKWFGLLLKELGLKRLRLNAYAWRHCLETIAGRCLDQPAIDAVMGHAPDATNMAAKYVVEIGEDRLRRVVNTVHEWLFKS